MRLPTCSWPLWPLASTLQVFDKHMPGPNQITSKLRQDVNVSQDDLLKVRASTQLC